MTRLPNDTEKVVCPESQSKKLHSPEKVYDGINPDGKSAPRGILAKHRHGWAGPECPYSGHVVDIARAPSPKEVKPAETKLEGAPDFSFFIGGVSMAEFSDKFWEQQWEEIAELLVGCD